MKRSRRRLLIQCLAAVFQNGYFQGFFQKTVFSGKTKGVCVPGLNCYSCPGALFACPIGALQGALNRRSAAAIQYVLGLLLLFGVVLGRLVCGFLCPFGLVQDLLHKIRTKKLTVPLAVDRPLRYLKYAVLAILVVILPLTLADAYGVAYPYFCKLLCPAGTLEGGIPLVTTSPELSAMTGALFALKMSILIAVLALSVFLFRPFCKYLCPLGALYGLFNGVGLYRLAVDKNKCVRCGRCERECPMQAPILTNPNHPECIRCQKCINVCPTRAISGGICRFSRAR